MRRRLCCCALGLSLQLLLGVGEAAAQGAPPTEPLEAAADVPRRLMAGHTPEPPAIDGRLEDEVWTRAPWSADFVDILTAAAPPLRTRVRLLWDEEALYVGAELEEPHVWGTLTRRDAVIYRDPDFEVFLDPDGDGRAYFELEINALGTEWDLLLTRPYLEDGSALNGYDMEGLRSAIHVEGTLNDPSDTDRFWSVELAIPWSDLSIHAGRPLPPAPGDVWRVNFSRVQWHVEHSGGAYRKLTDAQGEPLPEENWVWSPQGVINMHVPEHWGYVEFRAP